MVGKNGIAAGTGRKIKAQQTNFKGAAAKKYPSQHKQLILIGTSSKKTLFGFSGCLKAVRKRKKVIPKANFRLHSRRFFRLIAPADQHVWN